MCDENNLKLAKETVSKLGVDIYKITHDNTKSTINNLIIRKIQDKELNNKINQFNSLPINNPSKEDFELLKEIINYIMKINPTN